MSVGRVKKRLSKKTYHTLILIQHLIILTQADQKYQCRHVFKTMNPLLSLTPLTTNIEQFVYQLAHRKGCLRDTSGLDTAT